MLRDRVCRARKDIVCQAKDREEEERGWWRRGVPGGAEIRGEACALGGGNTVAWCRCHMNNPKGERLGRKKGGVIGLGQRQEMGSY